MRCGTVMQAITVSTGDLFLFYFRVAFFCFVLLKKRLKKYTSVYEKRWIIRYPRKINRNEYAKLRKNRLKRQKIHKYLAEHYKENKHKLFSSVNEFDQEIVINKLKCSRENL